MVSNSKYKHPPPSEHSVQVTSADKQRSLCSQTPRILSELRGQDQSRPIQNWLVWLRLKLFPCLAGRSLINHLEVSYIIMIGRTTMNCMRNLGKNSLTPKQLELPPILIYSKAITTNCSRNKSAGGNCLLYCTELG